MTEQYTQTIELTTPNSDKIKLIAGIAIMMLSLIFLIVGVLKNLLFLIGFGGFLTIGFALVQMFESAASGYSYSLSKKSLAVSKTNNAHQTKRIVCVKLDSIVRVERFCDILASEDIVACDTVADTEVCALVFKDEEKNAVRRLIFKPDGYMKAMLSELVEDKFFVGADDQ